MIDYKIEKDLTVEEFQTVLIKSTLGERRPVDDLERLQAMLTNADIIVTARDNGKLVGIARSITDSVYCTYLSDLAVDEAYQKMGIGKELIRQTKLAASKAILILLSAPAAVSYYPKIGMTPFENCYFLKNIEDLK
jgi:predicted N-acetyltransferase YhbS